ncbi:hypothetical protein SLA2020_289240 [Shorea laevis]
MKTNAFRGSNVFMSRKLVPPEVFDKLLGALKDNGAEVFLCCDPSRNGPNDFHVISSIDHEKFEDLRAKGCNLLGPQCVLTCAKENRALPKQGFTCCLAMDGLKVLASGFETDEKVKIQKLVTAMGGMLQSKASLDVSFVIVKNVLAAKYKWALNNSRKPIVTIQWLYQCWSEHRVVPQDSYRVLPFSGLTISVTRIHADERKEMEKLISQNGGKYSPELTKKCTHLICDISFMLSFAPEGDKYKVARRWGHIVIVTRKWFDQSIARRACLTEESYPVQGVSASLNKSTRGCSREQCSDVKFNGNSLSEPSSTATESTFLAVPAGFGDSDLEATLSQNMSSLFSEAQVITKEGEAPPLQATNETKLDGRVADDSQSEEIDLYLSGCRVSLVGFEASEMRKLVMMLRRGGASRYVSLNDKLTHIIVGTPSEMEKREIRSLAASGVIQVVKTTWIEDCDCRKREIPVESRHIAYDLLFPKDSVHSVKGSMTGTSGLNQNRSSVLIGSGVGMSSIGKNRDDRPQSNLTKDSSMEATTGLPKQCVLPIVNNKSNGQQKKQSDPAVQIFENTTSSSVFKGKVFYFSPSFPEDQKPDILKWVDQGGGEIVDDHVKQKVHFIVECHGVVSRSATDVQVTYVSTHWVKSCLEDGCLLDAGSHILYSPLTCQIPMPGFERFRFCVSQYEEKDRLLLRNLCYVLGSKFVEKLTKKVTHLLCKFASGLKYEAACRWGICSVTPEWIYDCVRLNQVVSPDSFFPKEVTAQDQEAGLCTVSQFPTQAFPMISSDNPLEFTSHSQDHRNAPTQTVNGKNGSIIGSGCDGSGNEGKISAFHNKKARLLKDDYQNHLLSSVVNLSNPVWNENSTGSNKVKDTGEVAHVVPDVAAAIEDLLEQTSKINDHKSPEKNGCDKSILSSDCTGICEERRDSHSVSGLSRHWLSRPVQKDKICTSGDASKGLFYGFSETQTDSQVVVYEEDLSGRQMLIDRVRTRGSGMT